MVRTEREINFNAPRLIEQLPPILNIFINDNTGMIIEMAAHADFSDAGHDALKCTVHGLIFNKA